MDSPTTTNVVGYFNPNTWPVSLHSSKLGFNNLIIAKGAYVQDDKGCRFNDPALEAFVGPNMLARQISDAPVPVYTLPAAAAFAPAAMGFPGFSGSRTVPAKMRPSAPEGSKPQAKPRQSQKLPPSRTALIAGRPVVNPPPGSKQGFPVVGMSMADARKLGLVASSVVAPVEGPDDAEGRDVAKTAPYIGIARDGQVKPGRRPSPVRKAPPEAVMPPPVKGGIADNLAKAAKIDPYAADPIAEERRVLAEEAATEPPAGQPVPPVVPVAAVSSDLPEPRIPAGPPSKDEGHPVSFVCKVDGKSFKRRHHLLQHARAMHAGQLDEIMVPYPEVKPGVAPAG